jgi:dephospho-CoA kinase
MLKYFGDAILDQNGEIDRKKLGPMVFSNKVYLSADWSFVIIGILIFL